MDPSSLRNPSTITIDQLLQLGDSVIIRVTNILSTISITQERAVFDPFEVAVWSYGSFWELDSLPSSPNLSDDEELDTDESLC
ncbi:NS7b protein [Wigeon coronavirus HKU20]|uniref:Non-structural protein 3b n=1 Tax=Wigeon coronavirus HKU20 TaxID=1159908 RepID=H9BR31_9NIDO|nr:NS7b protein [Wigeon coronavirus HKU20]AFD29240.1 NS7b protein [Wigeon coronavirus HKU20]